MVQEVNQIHPLISKKMVRKGLIGVHRHMLLEDFFSYCNKHTTELFNLKPEPDPRLPNLFDLGTYGGSHATS